MPIPSADVQELIFRSCLLLDQKDYKSWLALCGPNFRYAIRATSPEIRQEMTWLDHDRSELQTLFDNLHLHVVVPGDYHRHVGMTLETRNSDTNLTTESSVIVFHTTPQGASSLFALATYSDAFTIESGKPSWLSREVRMETRQLPFGPHIIL